MAGHSANSDFHFPTQTALSKEPTIAEPQFELARLAVDKLDARSPQELQTIGNQIIRLVTDYPELAETAEHIGLAVEE